MIRETTAGEKCDQEVDHYHHIILMKIEGRIHSMMEEIPQQKRQTFTEIETTIDHAPIGMYYYILLLLLCMYFSFYSNNRQLQYFR